jgi:hypothetical protein
LVFTVVGIFKPVVLLDCPVCPLVMGETFGGLAISNIMEEFIDYIEAFVIITNTELRTSQNELIIRLGENDLLQDLVENPAILVRILNYVQNTNHIELIVSHLRT